jgi:hypothetical protein
VLLEFEDHSQGAVVFVEGLFSNRDQERKVEIDRYREAFKYLRDAALSPRDSLGLIVEIGSKEANHESRTKEVRTGDAMARYHFHCRNGAGGRKRPPQRFGGAGRAPSSPRKACVECQFPAEKS